jgi:hypothetical protein
VNEAAGFIYTAAEAASQSAGLNMNNPQWSEAIGGKANNPASTTRRVEQETM